jgi:uncharacterized membrane protein YfcA
VAGLELAAAAALAGALVQSATGFGFALVLAPALFAAREASAALTALLVLGVVLNVLVLAERGTPSAVRWDLLRPMLAAALPGLVAGALLADAVSQEALQVAVGVVVVVAALVSLRATAPAGVRALRRAALAAGLGARRARRAALSAGLGAGFLTTTTSVNGPPLLLWLDALGTRPAEVRDSLAASFLVLNLAGTAALAGLAGADRALDLEAIAILLAPVVAGHALGRLAFNRLDARRFRAITLALALAAGVASVAAGLA